MSERDAHPPLVSSVVWVAGAEPGLQLQMKLLLLLAEVVHLNQQICQHRLKEVGHGIWVVVFEVVKETGEESLLLGEVVMVVALRLVFVMVEVVEEDLVG
jgi:hypothetical protein